MQKAIVCNIDEKFLECGTEFSDRFVYSNYFIPLSITFDDGKTEIVPGYKKGQILDYLTRDPLWLLKMKDAAERFEIPLGDFMQKNRIPLSPPIGTGPGSQPGPCPGSGPMLGTNYLTKDKIKATVRDVKDFTTLLRGKVSESDRGIVDLIERKTKEIDDAVEAAPPGAYGTPVVETAKMMIAEVAAVKRPLLFFYQAQEQEIDFFLNLLKSEVGYVFIDRTRIRPKGFAIGEHVYTLSLAPGEEVVLEQKTFSKRSMTFEEQTEEEKQFDIELSSTLTNEIQEGFQSEKSRTDATGFQAGGEIGVKFQIKKVEVNAKASLNYSRNITDANKETRTHSVKDSHTASSKVASKYRTIHKVTFKISTEEGFESTSKRVIKNPNKYTSIDLHYFKILRVLEMHQERYGVRLCWAPYIENPASMFFQQIIKGREKILQDAQAKIPQEPQPPQPTPPPNKPLTEVEKKDSLSAEIEANQWSGFVIVAMRHTYTLEINILNGYHWDGNIEAIKQRLRVRTTGPISVEDVTKEVTAAWGPDDGKVKVNVHIGAPDGGPGRHIFIQVGALFDKDQTLTQNVNEDTKFNVELADYLTRHKDWETKKNEILVQARKDMDAFEQEMLRKVNPIAEMMNRFIKCYFPSTIRNESWEIDLWDKMFDWNLASYVLYPSWWSDLQMQDPTKEPTHFFNASWARLYLPIRIGYERLALRWIFGKVTEAALLSKELGKQMEDQFEKIENDMKDYRKNSFGKETETNIGDEECAVFTEKSLCLAKWTELMPTDGTHIEVVQSMTSAADQFSKNEVEDANTLRDAMIESEKQDVELKRKAQSQMTQAPSVEVKINTDRGAGGGG